MASGATGEGVPALLRAAADAIAAARRAPGGRDRSHSPPPSEPVRALSALGGGEGWVRWGPAAMASRAPGAAGELPPPHPGPPPPGAEREYAAPRRRPPAGGQGRQRAAGRSGRRYASRRMARRAGRGHRCAGRTRRAGDRRLLRRDRARSPRPLGLTRPACGSRSSRPPPRSAKSGSPRPGPRHWPRTARPRRNCCSPSPITNDMFLCLARLHLLHHHRW